MQSTKIQRFTFFTDFSLGEEVVALIDCDDGPGGFVKSKVYKIGLGPRGVVYILESGHHVSESYAVSTTDHAGMLSLLKNLLKL